MNKQIEIEMRSMFDESTYKRVKTFLDENAESLGQDDKFVHFYILPDKLLKVTNNESKGTAKITLKLNRIGQGSDFEEIEVPIDQGDVEKIAKIFDTLELTDNVMRNGQKRQNYIYKGVEIALKWSEVWGYHLELEVLVDDTSKKDDAERQIQEVAKELNIALMTEEELQAFVEKVERENKK